MIPTQRQQQAPPLWRDPGPIHPQPSLPNRAGTDQVSQSSLKRLGSMQFWLEREMPAVMLQLVPKHHLHQDLSSPPEGSVADGTKGKQTPVPKASHCLPWSKSCSHRPPHQQERWGPWSSLTTLSEGITALCGGLLVFPWARIPHAYFQSMSVHVTPFALCPLVWPDQGED